MHMCEFKSMLTYYVLYYTFSGGSFANIMSVNIARYKACPDIKKTGLFGLKRLKIYISAEVNTFIILIT